MDTTDQITSLIEKVSTLPNSLAKNKCISFLHNARVWAKELELSKQPDNAAAESNQSDAKCICPTGGRRRDCPATIHHN